MLQCCKILLVLRNRTQKDKYLRRPPGSTSWPFISNMLQILIQISMTKMRVKYGEVRMGSMVVVVLSGYDTLGQALVRQGGSFAGTPELYSFSSVANGTFMTFNEKYGKAWILRKNICKNALHTFSQAEAKGSAFSCLLQEHVWCEASEMVSRLKEHSNCESSLDATIALITSVANIAYAFSFSKRYSYNDEESLNVVQINNEVLADLSKLRYFPSPSEYGALHP